MAIDTAEKRSSCLGWGIPSARAGFFPDGSDLDAAQRLHAAYLYSGLAAGVPGSIEAIGTTDGGPSAAGPGYIWDNGDHQVLNGPRRKFFRLDNPGNASSDGSDGELRIEWRALADLTGGDFMVYLGSPGTPPTLLGRLTFARRGGAVLNFTLPSLGGPPCQYDRFVVPGAVLEQHDGGDFFYVYFAPRDFPLFMYVTGLQLDFESA